MTAFLTLSDRIGGVILAALCAAFPIAAFAFIG